MLDLSDTSLATVQGTYVLLPQVESSLEGEVLSEDIPVASGSLEIDRTIGVPERLSLTVPREDRGMSWDPTGEADHPLAPYGQRLRLSLGVGIGRAIVEWVNRGEYLITQAAVSGDAVEVEAVGLLHLIHEARFTTPFQPSGTFQTTIRGLVEPALSVEFASSGLPTNRNVPSGLAWDEDRLGALTEVLDAWPADAYVDSAGVLQVTAASDSTTSVLTLTDGEGGTVVTWSGSATRDQGYNMVVARGQDTDLSTVQGVAYDLAPTSPLRYGGPFNPLPVPYFYFSPLLNTTAQCQAAAATVLARLRRTATRELVAEAVPHPGLEAGDLVTVEGRVEGTAIVERMRLPLTADGGSMTLGMRVVSGG